MTDRTHLSIGEVLSLLQEEFPDITISKIRFLESQGLIDPERTPSGYRKFHDADIARLRWILRQQREHFLPLKVIKDRIAAGEVDLDEPDAAHVGAATAEAATPAPAATTGPAEAPPERHAREAAAALLQEAPTPRGTARSAEASSAPAPAPLLDTGSTAVSLSLEELLGATGLTAREVGDLERYGMLESRSIGSTTYYDEDALLVARLAATFRSHGIEARHLRMYKVAAEREAGVFEQVIMPLLRKRSPQARQQATDLLNELAALGDGLRAAMLRQALRDYLGRG